MKPSSKLAGLGAITEPLMTRVDHLHVVEIDRDLIVRLRNNTHRNV
jgi:16S rRNA (adenine1518-N6/adenine1519-N6)-dimethyltransferase